jgi:UrcA family protein
MLLKPTIVLGGLAAAALLMASPRLRAENAPVVRVARSTNVYFGDLNLNKPGDVAALYKRIRVAADRVCGSRAFTGLYYTYTEYRSCVADATQQAVGEVHRSALTHLYRSRFAHSAAIRVAER